MEDKPGLPDDQATAEEAATEALLVRLVDNLDEGFTELVRHFERAAYSLALRLTRNPVEAEDLAADTFLRAYRALRGYDASRIRALRPRAWLCTITLNAWRNNVRQASRRPGQISMDGVPDQPAGGPDVLQVVESGETQRELGRLVTQLPTVQKVAVLLRHVVGLPVAEVAAVMRCPEGTAKSHVSRGLRRLRSLYTAHPPAATVPAPRSRRRPLQVVRREPR
jgi:RNA polymerase sigma-70 factor (ECF subfamily)